MFLASLSMAKNLDTLQGRDSRWYKSGGGGGRMVNTALPRGRVDSDLMPPRLGGAMHHPGHRSGPIMSVQALIYKLMGSMEYSHRDQSYRFVPSPKSTTSPTHSPCSLNLQTEVCKSHRTSPSFIPCNTRINHVV